jgi:protein TonB
VTALHSDIRRPSFSRSGIVLSIVLHVLLVYVLLNEELLWARLQPSDTPHVEVELVPEPPKPLPPPPVPKPDAPKPEQPKPEAAEPPKPPPPALPRLLPPPAVPQLVPGRLAEHSAVPHPAPRNGGGGSGAALAMSSGPGVTLLPKEQAKAGRPGATGPEGAELTQSEQDFILAQIMKYWTVDPHAPQARGLVLQGVFYIQADGTLASPVNKNDPWNPAAVVDDYYAMVGPEGSYRREAIDGFLLALRLCQPLQLPPSSTGPWPRRIVIRFAFDKL